MSKKDEALADHIGDANKMVEQPAQQQEPIAWVYPEGLEALKAGKPWTAYGRRQEPNNTALYLSPQPDIPPYAWVTFTPYGDEDDVWYENPEGQLLEGWTYKPLYDTTPPQPEPVIDKSAAIRIATSLGWEPKRTWQGLTDEEIVKVLGNVREIITGNVFLHFARAIEATIRSKNP